MQKYCRVYTERALSAAEQIVLSSEQGHYIANVLRKKVNDHLLIFNGQAEYLAKLVEVTKKGATVSIESATRHFIPKPVKLSLYYSPIKNADTSFIMQKATELGVDTIQPINFTRTVVNKINLERAKKVAIEAAEQCGRINLPEIYNISSFRDVQLPPEAIIIFCNELEKEHSFFKLSNLNLKIKDELIIIIGPEGGFSEEERNTLLKQNNMFSVSLGRNILRAETAIITALALTNELLLPHD